MAWEAGLQDIAFRAMPWHWGKPPPRCVAAWRQQQQHKANLAKPNLGKNKAKGQGQFAHTSDKKPQAQKGPNGRGKSNRRDAFGIARSSATPNPPEHALRGAALVAQGNNREAEFGFVLCRKNDEKEEENCEDYEPMNRAASRRVHMVAAGEDPTSWAVVDKYTFIGTSLMPLSPDLGNVTSLSL